MLFFAGLNVPADLKKALYWATLRPSNTYAFTNWLVVAISLTCGDDLRDFDRANLWARRGAKMGDPVMLYCLAAFHAVGLGRPRDPKEASLLYGKIPKGAIADAYPDPALAFAGAADESRLREEVIAHLDAFIRNSLRNDES